MQTFIRQQRIRCYQTDKRAEAGWVLGFSQLRLCLSFTSPLSTPSATSRIELYSERGAAHLSDHSRGGSLLPQHHKSTAPVTCGPSAYAITTSISQVNRCLRSTVAQDISTSRMMKRFLCLPLLPDMRAVATRPVTSPIVCTAAIMSTLVCVHMYSRSCRHICRMSAHKLLRIARNLLTFAQGFLHCPCPSFPSVCTIKYRLTARVNSSDAAPETTWLQPCSRAHAAAAPSDH
jgi:hypothetical protein